MIASMTQEGVIMVSVAAGLLGAGLLALAAALHFGRKPRSHEAGEAESRGGGETHQRAKVGDGGASEVEKTTIRALRQSE